MAKDADIDERAVEEQEFVFQNRSSVLNGEEESKAMPFVRHLAFNDKTSSELYDGGLED